MPLLYIMGQLLNFITTTGFAHCRVLLYFLLYGLPFGCPFQKLLFDSGGQPHFHVLEAAVLLFYSTILSDLFVVCTKYVIIP